MSQRLTTCVFMYSGFQDAPNPGAFGITSDVSTTTVVGFLNNIRIFYNYCLELEKQLDRSDIRINIAFAKYAKPVNADIRKLQIKFNKLERVAKERYKARRGLKIARGFAESPEGKAFFKKKQQAFQAALASPAKDLSEKVVDASKDGKPDEDERQAIGFLTGFKSITFPVFYQIFYNVLSYGNKNVKKIQSDIQNAVATGVYIVSLSDSNF